MSRAENQLRTFETLWDEIRPHIRTDRNLPARIQQRLAKEKRFGSRDRRLYRELIYTALRHLPWLETQNTHASPSFIPHSELRISHLALWLAPDTPGTLPLKQQLLANFPPAPATIAERAALLGEQPAALLPAWFREHCPAAFEPPNIDALHTRAPLWLRLQTDDPAPVFAEFTARGWTWRASPVLPDAIELQAANDPDLTKTEAHQRGLFEIQDLGSQLILPTALASFSPSALQSFSLFLDACAGAGGKTLQLARLFPNAQIDATDPRPDALAELKTRAARANIKNIRIVPQPTLASGNPKSHDVVVVDAPCSGTGTWRRAPHLKYTTTEATIRDAAALQQKIFRRHAPLVRDGGLLIYATCSLSRRENEDVVAAFLADPAHADFTLVRQTTILPAEHNTDGFFTATLRRGSI
ncbi:16S rRNA (cytosine967-C5)-methyltransferase [Ereboglobus sp. PH5-10]|uniref:RsmB/NOP family class I SAM-dependent RNA methyltransferase n=1 Tax=Ereboglobus sp. PH5-10 TaxID=2940629 RepID=UPI002406FA61|nr:RsmB/NOP family class I SAM-dependent RNA methyltransferase [Ereboglobus sp. PH5-10]MDF9826908.1 16S rRNA (cytosine967-C5)-methyltransferase [Ereboglobus sp. PH5-10]